MDFTEKLIEQYAKKIYGFAYGKTGNTHDAEDLSQSILLTLCKIDFAGKDIADMDGYIFRVCNYTWSNFLRKNKSMWHAASYADELENSESDENLEEELVKNETYMKLRRELMYLSRMKREITIMFYYDGKSGKEIAEKLGIPTATVRWHLGEAKKTLKERIEMTDTIYRPKKLDIYFCGSMNEPSRFRDLRGDLLTQNICIACAGKPVTIEEIAQTLCMSALFIENKLENLLYMGYIEKVGANKYRTTFLIKDENFVAARTRYKLARYPAVAEGIYEAVKEFLPKIKGIGFYGSDLPERELMWTLCGLMFIEYLAHIENKIVPEETPLPIRGDGSRHRIIAEYSTEDVFEALPSLSADEKEYILSWNGVSGCHSGDRNLTVQMHNPICAGCDGRRELNSSETKLLQNIRKMIADDIIPESNADKETVAYFVKKGIVSVENGKPKILIPYFTAKQIDELFALIKKEIIPAIDNRIGTEWAENYYAAVEKYIPDYVSEDEHTFVKERPIGGNEILYLLMKTGKLEKPTEEEAKRICLTAWEQK